MLTGLCCVTIKYRLFVYSLYHRSTNKVENLRAEDEWNPWGEELHRSAALRSAAKYQRNTSVVDSSRTVEIWGKAAIGLYTWQHIFNGQLLPKAGGAWSYGYQRVGDIKFKFRTGPGIAPSTVPSDVTHVLLVLNGRTPEKIKAAKVWLNSLPSFSKLQKAAAIVLGDEDCSGNMWLLPYVASRGGLLSAVFLVYDTALVDGKEFFQWPLGVATYRGFPKASASTVDITSKRPYLCNFLGTVYKGSSREELVSVLRSDNIGKQCFVKHRNEWQPLETRESLEMYTLALEHSDLTLNPVGKNPECYRIYEAASYGSVPVVEDRLVSSQCATAEDGGPLRLLKKYGAPFVYVRNWTVELPRVLERERRLSVQEKVKRRRNLIAWYEGFKRSMKEELVKVIQWKFFDKAL
ncbi:ribitol-5-phosphate xylosyltransferase 1-like isoform X2 [Ornithodoros turicata]|uniref:ribitol-5-phosphate xylosyltransferase 1-like isoform X2 n=1 Tax=Ornithodoros turicata TaxID=34597 RepID=UPI003139AEAC